MMESGKYVVKIMIIEIVQIFKDDKAGWFNININEMYTLYFNKKILSVRILFFLDNRWYFSLKKIFHMLQKNNFLFLYKNKIEI